MSFDYSQPHTIINGVPVALTTDQQAALITAQAAAAAAMAQQNLVAGALAALAVTDSVFIRCGKAAVAWPSEWQDYVIALRTIVESQSGTLPTRPLYPAGT